MIFILMKDGTRAVASIEDVIAGRKRGQCTLRVEVIPEYILDGQKMANGEQSGSGGQVNWRIRFATMVGAGIGAALSLLLGSVVDFHGFGVSCS